MVPLPSGTRSALPEVTRRRHRLPGAWIAICFLATASLTGCAGDSPDGGRTGGTAAATGPRPWATSESWWEVTLEAASEPDLFLAYIGDLEVDSRGRVFLVDRLEGGITVLTPELRLLATVGREGEGPGEFRFMEVQILPGDTLLVYDFGLGRITLFDPENLELVTTMPPPNLERGTVTNLWKLQGQGHFFALDRLPYVTGAGEAADQGRTEVLLAFDESAEVIDDTLATVAGSEMLVFRREGFLSVGSHPFGRESLVGLLADDRIVYANSAAFDVTVLDFAGATVHSFSHPVPPIPVTPAELRAEVEEMREPMAEVLRSGAPYTWPALAGLVTDDEERIWVGIRGSGGSSDWEWAAFAPDGTHAGSILLPAGHLLQVVRDNRIYVLSHDDFDVPSIQAYRLETSGT